MAISTPRLHRLLRLALIAADALVGLALLAVVGLLWLEGEWTTPHSPSSPRQAFLSGTIGTELMPLAVAEVLPGLASQFQPIRTDGSKCEDWVACFGFIPSPDGKSLPVGFAVTNYRPRSGAPSPTPFVGFSCALCHTTVLRLAGDHKPIYVEGPGSSSLNLFAWLDALQAALLERLPPTPGASVDPAHPRPYKITVGMIAREFQKKRPNETLGLIDRGMIWLWLKQFRGQLEAGLPRFDEPYGRGLSRLAENVPTGPTRTQPFRTLIRQVLDRPGDDMRVYTKIATIFSEDWRTSAQFDGSIQNDLYARSSMAALAAGATAQNMRKPEIVEDIRAASDFTRTLRPPRFSDLFPEEARGLDPGRVARGKEVYQQHCFGCHGAPDGKGGWSAGDKMGTVIRYEDIGTDPERVTFRHYGELPERLFLLLPKNHPFHFERSQMLPSQADKDDLKIRGYVAQPLDGMFLRAPYLHNASVLTLAELINLKKRRDNFTRGDDIYDPNDVGFASGDDKSYEHYFFFDTGLLGNSNKGHDYPWTFEDARGHVDDLTALLDYLKTL